MNTKHITALFFLTIFCSAAFAFTPQPCLPNTECDCSVEFCTYEQVKDYFFREKVKDVFGLIGSAFGKSTTFDVYIYGTIPPESLGRTVSKVDFTPLGTGYKGKWIVEHENAESVQGMHLYKVKVDPFNGWNKKTFYTFSTPVWGPTGVKMSFAVADPEVNHVSEVKSDNILLKKFESVCNAWRGKVEPWPCASLFPVGETTVIRNIIGTVSPSNAMASVFAETPDGKGKYAVINYSGGTFTISPVEPGQTYKLSVLAKQGSEYSDWAQTVAVPLDKDASVIIALQKNLSAQQSKGNGSVSFNFSSEKGENIAATVELSLLTNQSKVDSFKVPTTGLSKTGLVSGNYKIVVTPENQKYVPNPQIVYSFPVQANATKTLNLVFSETEGTQVVQPPAGAKTGDVYYRFTQPALDALKAKGISTEYANIVSAMKVNNGSVKVEVFIAQDGKQAVKFNKVSSRVAYNVEFYFPGFNKLSQQWTFEDGEINE